MAKKASSRKVSAGKKSVVSSASKRVAKRPARAEASRPLVSSKKIKSPLTKAELTEFRRMLLEKRKALLGDMYGIEAEALRTNRQEGSGDLSNMPTHPADIGTDNFEQEFTLGLLESERTLLHEINQALERIESGTYGVCMGTGQPIGLARLRARPWAKHSIEYARMLEKGLVRPGQEHETQAEEEPSDEEEEAAEEELPADDLGDEEVIRDEEEE